MRLSTRIALSLIVVEGVSLGVGTWVVNQNTRKVLREEFSKRAEVIAQSMGISAGSVLCNTPAKSDEFLRQETQAGELSYAVVRRQGVVFASSGDLGKVISSFENFTKLKKEIERKQVYSTFVTIPACHSGERDFELEIGVDFHELERPLQGVIRTEITSLSVQILLAILVAVVMGRAFGRKIANIEEACKRISEGNFDVRIASDGNDEFSAIGGAINSMSASLVQASVDRDRQRQELASSAKLTSLGEMAGGVAHEINNPLAILVGRVTQLKRVLKKEPVDARQGLDLLDRVGATLERIEKIVRGLKLFSRNAEQDPKVAASLNSIIESSLDLCSERFKNSGVEIRYTQGADVHICCRPTQISQVLINLLNNSYDAILSLSEKWVSLEVRDLGEGRVGLNVTDSGGGIPKATADKLMQPFFTTKPVGKGTGLGLSISKGIVEDHGGQMYLNSASRNTQFCLEFPACAPTPIQQSA